GEVEKGTKVTISCATGEAKIYYTVDGSEPTAESTEYTAEISIDSAMTIKAIAVKEGMENSKVAEAAYTVKTVANEGEELTGVSVYPNPNTGVFYIELPVDATIDIFATNGVLVRSINAKAGKATLSLDYSGIYFLRIAGEGTATVKRVIVR
ncbi:MAG: chitobiase/beta-hexosaminidase C-terminal domain-containing protein, partial [Bacteroidales bacterium]|nr:chitobiase/beta-hexosaminidase C-terminal domain-containing protein [Bacteroidales bacterium]